MTLARCKYCKELMWKEEMYVDNLPAHEACYIEKGHANLLD